MLALMLAGCAASPAGPSESVPGAPSSQPSPPDADPARTAVAVMGTPFFFAFKVAVCATTAVIAAPVAALLALVEEPHRGQKRQELNEGFARNCGPPYVLSP